MRFCSNKIIIAALLFTCINHAYAKGDSGNHGKKNHRPTFASIDTNQDSDIDFDEFSQQQLPFGDPQTVFSAIDSNNNGVLDEDEYLTHKPPHRNKRKGRKYD
jgi:hypothetical protein